ncbi:MAG: RsmF rRNA methyltransferase first C-terminal domain-containing protein [Lactobacillaceae bacterium]|jgi:NOL1/NOP2/sun family putative RNA methylase|nr:RsmF rRNA methyltransferase first C-terminal domain-containing protein [Lactobacillaceae bacterium]
MQDLLPEQFKEKYRSLLGDEAEAFLASFDKPHTAGFDINEEKIDPNFDQPEVVWNEEVGRRGQVSGHSVEHVTGVVYSQEPSAQFVGKVVDAKPGEVILDAAAAPGGKSFEIANQMHNHGLLITNEFVYKRSKVLSENMERMGVKNSVVTSHDLSVFAQNTPNFFDKVLLDAPCSGEGMFRKDPKGIEYWTPTYSNELAELQKSILENVVQTVKPGGELIYSTCTFAPEENEQVISWLLENYPEFTLEPIEKYDGFEDGRPEWGNGDSELSKTARLWPHKIDGEGHFVAKLKKAEIGDPSQIKELQPNISKNQTAIYRTWEKENLNTTFDNLYAFGDFIYAYPTGVPEAVSKMKVLRLGIQLGEVKKDRFVPSHSLAITLKTDDVKNHYELTDEQWKLYVHGDVVKTEIPDGWVLVTKGQNPVGWGKAVQNTIKNFYPKSFRFEVKG